MEEIKRSGEETAAKEISEEKSAEPIPTAKQGEYRRCSAESPPAEPGQTPAESPVQHSLSSLEKAMVASWRTSRKEQAGKIHQMILTRAKTDAKFREECLEGFDRFLRNSAYFPLKMGAEGKKIAILGWKSPAVGEWDPSGVEKGLAGSEEAVVYAGEVLAKKGYRVTIYMNPPYFSLWRLPSSNPVYKDCDLFLKESPKSPDSEEFDAVIAWRHTQFHTARQRSKKVYFWPHDLASFAFRCDNLTGVFYLSEFHRKQMTAVCPALSSVPYVISGNGICLEQFSQPKSFSNPLSCIYASNYSRGLGVLVEIWPEIKQMFPSATLDIYYGRQTWGTMKPEEEKELHAKLEALRKLDVCERGMVGHQQLAEAFQKTSILTYPCTTEAETFCITVVKAQAAGMVPVTTRVGALKETVHPKAPTVEKITKAKEYRDRLVNVMRRIEKAGASRDEYIEFGRKYTWESCVEKWLELIDGKSG